MAQNGTGDLWNDGGIYKYSVAKTWNMRRVINMLSLSLGAVILGACYDDYEVEPDNNWNDEDMYACTDEWRNIHPYGYNPVTGGWNAEEDEENGW